MDHIFTTNDTEEAKRMKFAAKLHKNNKTLLKISHFLKDGEGHDLQNISQILK